jgi:hypothetical protein
MIKQQLSERFTAKWWEETPVDEQTLQYVLDCAYLAPSKQGRYNYNIYVLGNTEPANDFKKWLYWENTWCLDKVRGKPGEGLRRYNGQVIAPVVLMWVAKDTRSFETRDDCLISATVAMCSASEKGLQTGFNSCIGPTDIADKLSIKGTPILCLGLGYATPDDLKSRQVYSNNDHVGFDLSNTDPKITDGYNRINKPSFQDLMVFI